MISIEDFHRWKQDSVTRAFYMAVHDRIEDAKDNNIDIKKAFLEYADKNNINVDKKVNESDIN